MKKAVIIFLLVTQPLLAQSGFEIGNTLYQQGNYEGAVTAYENVLVGKKQSAELYFNLANSYYKLNKVAPAIYNYEKALLLNPGDVEIQNNLTFAHKMTIDEIKDVPQVGFAKMLRDFTGSFSYDGWAWISVGFASLFLLFFLGYYFSQTTFLKRVFFIGMFVVVFLIIIGILAAVSEKNHDVSERPAIVFSEITPVKSEPKDSGSDIFILHEGTKVFVDEMLDNWKKIRLSDGSEGWIQSSAIREIKE